MLGDSNAISGNTIASGSSAPLTYNIVGRQITVARGAISVANLHTIGGQQINAYQGYFPAFQDMETLVGRSVTVQHGSFSLYQGFPPPSQISMEARQGAIQIQKLIYFLYTDTAYFSENTFPVELYLSFFAPDTDDRIIVVDGEEERGIEILEEYRDMLVAPARVGYP